MSIQVCANASDRMTVQGHEPASSRCSAAYFIRASSIGSCCCRAAYGQQDHVGARPLGGGHQVSVPVAVDPLRA